MRTLCSRLVASVVVVAYFLANTHASLVIDAHLQSHASSGAVPDSQTAETPHGQKHDDECPHCSHCNEREHGTERTCAHADDGSQGSQTSRSNCPDGPAGSECPCCPNGPSESTCPCPGGCALCSVAKIPCVCTGLLQMMPVTCTGQCKVDEAFLYVPPSSSGLMRPPRA
jgi:hypothetical protein